MRQRGMTNRNARQNQPEAANQPPAKTSPHPPSNCSANGQDLTAVQTLVTALQRRPGRGHKAASQTRPDKNITTDQPEKLATKLAINLSIRLAGRSSATAMAVPVIMRVSDRKSPGRSHGFAAPLATGNPVAGTQNRVLNQALNRVQVARGG
jgi:hypothetical protein